MNIFYCRLLFTVKWVFTIQRLPSSQSSGCSQYRGYTLHSQVGVHNTEVTLFTVRWVFTIQRLPPSQSNGCSQYRGYSTRHNVVNQWTEVLLTSLQCWNRTSAKLNVESQEGYMWCALRHRSQWGHYCMCETPILPPIHKQSTSVQESNILQWIFWPINI